MNKYNQLTIQQEVIKNGRRMFVTKCDCGKLEVKRKDWVLSGRTTSCKSCSCKRTAAKYPPPVNRTGCEGLSGTHYLAIKYGASRRNILFDVTPEFLWKLYEKQDGLCALTGVPIVLTALIKNQNVDWDVVTASLDRIQNDGGYTTDNVQWVHKTINRLKNNYSLEELLYWSKLLLKKHGYPEPSLSGDTLEGATTRDRDSRVGNVPTSPQPRYHFTHTGASSLCNVLPGEDIV